MVGSRRKLAGCGAGSKWGISRFSRPLARAGKPRQGYRRVSDLRNQINSLSPAEQAELLDTVWESLEADAASLTDAQRAECDYRIARHEQNPTDAMPWEQVKARLLKKP
jgi:putative addiction module component (TIGR02574 family)